MFVCGNSGAVTGNHLTLVHMGVLMSKKWHGDCCEKVVVNTDTGGMRGGNAALGRVKSPAMIPSWLLASEAIQTASSTNSPTGTVSVLVCSCYFV